MIPMVFFSDNVVPTDQDPIRIRSFYNYLYLVARGTN